MDILNSEDWPMRAKEQGWNRCFLAVLYGEKIVLYESTQLSVWQFYFLCWSILREGGVKEYLQSKHIVILLSLTTGWGR